MKRAGSYITVCCPETSSSEDEECCLKYDDGIVLLSRNECAQVIRLPYTKVTLLL